MLTREQIEEIQTESREKGVSIAESPFRSLTCDKNALNVAESLAEAQPATKTSKMSQLRRNPQLIFRDVRGKHPKKYIFQFD